MMNLSAGPRSLSLQVTTELRSIQAIMGANKITWAKLHHVNMTVLEISRYQTHSPHENESNTPLQTYYTMKFGNWYPVRRTVATTYIR